MLRAAGDSLTAGRPVECPTAGPPDGPTARRPDGPTARRPDGPTARPPDGPTTPVAIPLLIGSQLEVTVALKVGLTLNPAVPLLIRVADLRI